ncbi:MAG: hypothetical protein IPM77_00700 [Crocinitomicaceae bacterium]|nr:hypothetical protein [Crocinitomicaceae bacterium]
MSIFTLPIVIAIACSTLFFKHQGEFVYYFNWQTIWFNNIHSTPWLNFLLAGAFISLNAHQLNNVFNRNTFFSKDSFLPGFIYVTGLITFNQLEFSPLLIGHTFIIGAFAALLQLKRQEPAKNQVFIGSFLIGMAIVFSPMQLTLALLPWISLIIIRPFNWREWIIALIGIGIPIYFHFTVYFISTGKWDIESADFVLYQIDLTWTIMDQIKYGFFSFCVFIAILRYLIIMRNQLVNFKKISQVVLAAGLLSVFSFFIGWYGFNMVYSGFLIPAGIIISVQLLYSERSAFSSGLVTIWFFVALAGLFI